MPLGRGAGRRTGRRSARRMIRRQDMFSGAEEPMDQETPMQEASATDQLEEIAALKEKGLITQEEYDAKKRQILGL